MDEPAFSPATKLAQMIRDGEASGSELDKQPTMLSFYGNSCIRRVLCKRP